MWIVSSFVKINRKSLMLRRIYSPMPIIFCQKSVNTTIMWFNTKFLIVLHLVFSNSFEANATRVRAPGEEAPPRRDYRPTKWLTNSAMDIWYGNKTFIDIMWREFSDFMSKITERDGIYLLPFWLLLCL